MMNEITQWVSALGQQGIIAAALLLIFVVIVVATLYTLWQLKSSHLNSPVKPPKPSRPFTDQEKLTAQNQTTENNKDSATLVEEAQVFIDYGLKQQAIDALTRHLLAQPKDKKAQKMLDKLNSSLGDETQS